MHYYKDAAGNIGEYRRPQPSLTEATVQERNGHLLAEAEQSKRAELDAAYEAAIVADVTYAGDIYQADSRIIDKLKRLDVYRSTSTPLPAGFTWRTKDNQDRPFTWADIDGLVGAISANEFAASENLKVKKNALKAAVLLTPKTAAITAVNAINW